MTETWPIRARLSLRLQGLAHQWACDPGQASGIQFWDFCWNDRKLISSHLVEGREKEAGEMVGVRRGDSVGKGGP